MKQGGSQLQTKAAIDLLLVGDEKDLDPKAILSAAGNMAECHFGSLAELARHIAAVLTQNMIADLKLACQRPDHPWIAVADCLLTHLLAENRIAFMRYVLKHDLPIVLPRAQITQTLLPLAQQHLDHLPVPDVTPKVMVEWFFGICVSDTELRRLTGDLAAPSAQMIASRAASVDATLKRVVHPSRGTDHFATIAV
ncbi:MAG: hypothetical protein P8Q92_07165 [Pseudoprimorskyibacter sp.]|jgi:hypothetical protein|nr:hypothetical protein [Pseudoprimorskyibacter sp.]